MIELKLVISEKALNSIYRSSQIRKSNPAAEADACEKSLPGLIISALQKGATRIELLTDVELAARNN